MSNNIMNLEVPMNDQYRCLSPITEMPSPLPTPMPSPLPTPYKHRMLVIRDTSTESSSNLENTADETESETSFVNLINKYSSSTQEESFNDKLFHIDFDKKPQEYNSPPLVIPKLVFNVDMSPTNDNFEQVNKIKVVPPPLNIHDSNLNHFCENVPYKDYKQPNHLQFNFEVPEIKIDDHDIANKTHDIPHITVEHFSDIPVINVENENGVIMERFDSSPRFRSQSIDSTNSLFRVPTIEISPAECYAALSQYSRCEPGCSNNKSVKTRRQNFKTSSGKLPNFNSSDSSNTPTLGSMDETKEMSFKSCAHTIINYPVIQIDSDSESPPNNRKSPRRLSSNFLSPFLGCGFNASESNLSCSSGYSSAYSPEPSRCNSNNPLFLIESDYPVNTTCPQFKSPVFIDQSNAINSEIIFGIDSCPRSESGVSKITNKDLQDKNVNMTDNETTADELQTSQVDSALDIDTNDEPEVENTLFEMDTIIETQNTQAKINNDKTFFSSLSLQEKSCHVPKKLSPTLVVHASLHHDNSIEDYVADRPLKLSPVSSRSESPISDCKFGVTNIYPEFFNNKGKLELPYTDSDALYDFPSSEVLCSDNKCEVVRRSGKKKKRSSLKNKEDNAIWSSKTYYNDEESTQHPQNIPISTSNKNNSPSEHSFKSRSSRITLSKRRKRSQTGVNRVNIMSSSNESLASHG